MPKHSKNPHMYLAAVASSKPAWWDALIGVVPGVTHWQPLLVSGQLPSSAPAADQKGSGSARSRHSRMSARGAQIPPLTRGTRGGHATSTLFEPARVTPLHAWHVRRGAEFEDAGLWRRPWFFPEPGENLHQSVDRECLAIRRGVGIMDTSAWGRIDIQGVDAREFLARIYPCALSGLEAGRCRYGPVSGEGGPFPDDGLLACLGDNHFIITVHGGEADMLSWLMRRHRREWPELALAMTSVTDHWATMTVSGPDSRKVLERVGAAVDLSGETFAPMEWRPATVAGVAARIFRISLTGELSFDIMVQASYGLHVWEALMEAGAGCSITPCGTEAMAVLRAEKGYITAGRDSDGSLLPGDMASGSVPGEPPAFASVGQGCERRQLVGLKARDPRVLIPVGAQIVLDPGLAMPAGRVSSSHYSANLGHTIALGLMTDGQRNLGETVYCLPGNGRVLEAEVTSPVFYDPAGERQHL